MYYLNIWFSIGTHVLLKPNEPKMKDYSLTESYVLPQVSGRGASQRDLDCALSKRQGGGLLCKVWIPVEGLSGGSQQSGAVRNSVVFLRWGQGKQGLAKDWVLS